jgi:hypothetical protein
MSAVPSAVSPAVPSVAIPGDLVNIPVANPALERYPGPVSPGDYDDAGPDYPIEGPPQGSWLPQEFTGHIPNLPSGGGIQDYSWTTGTDGPMVPWDSAAGEPFAPSKAVNPDLHAQDTGAVFVNQYVVPAFIGKLQRTTTVGQTYNREYSFDPVNGGNVPAANMRVDYDQRQPWDPAPGDGGGYAPWDPGYAERPILNNVAYQATPVNTIDNIYGVNGALPDRSQFQAYAAEAYEAPANPDVGTPSAPAASTGGGWLLG